MGTRIDNVFLSLLLYSTIIVNLLVGTASAQTQPTGQTINLFSVELVTSLDSQVGGGGFDTSTDFDRRLVSTVEDCIDHVVEVCRSWADNNQLTVLQCRIEKHHEPRQVYLQFGAEKLAGIFEVMYRVNSNEGRAQGSYWFYDTSGTRRHPNIDPYRGLGDLLLGAMQCGK